LEKALRFRTLKINLLGYVKVNPDKNNWKEPDLAKALKIVNQFIL